MKLNLNRDIAALRTEAWARIDAAAEQSRVQFMTLGSGQAMVYDQKRREAEAFMANPAVSPGEIPHLVAEATQNGLTSYDQAVIYLTMSQQWLTVSPIIENIRLGAKTSVGAATSPASILAVEAAIWWPSL
ncbi:hypothetical protein [Rhizobium arsenicireducens]